MGFLKPTTMAKFLLKADSDMHNKASDQVTQAETQFFDETPTGTILNRLSNNLGSPRCLQLQPADKCI